MKHPYVGRQHCEDHSSFDSPATGALEEFNLTGTPLGRLGKLARAWRVKIEDLLETETSVIAFGTRDVLEVAGAEEFRLGYSELLVQLEALGLHVENEDGQPLDTVEIKLEDLSRYYVDEAERWLYVTLKSPADYEANNKTANR